MDTQDKGESLMLFLLKVIWKSIWTIPFLTGTTLCTMSMYLASGTRAGDRVWSDTKSWLFYWFTLENGGDR